MASKRPEQRTGPLLGTDRVLWQEIEGGVYAPGVFLAGYARDSLTGALATIDYPHHEIHAGGMFSASYKSADVSPIADNGVIEMLLVVPAGVGAHASVSIAGGADTEVVILESPAVTDSGTAVARVNMNRNSARHAAVTAFHTPTYTGGAVLVNTLEPGGRGPQSGGGVARSGAEWILAAGRSYVFRGINRGGTAQPMSVHVQWYEEGIA